MQALPSRSGLRHNEASKTVNNPNFETPALHLKKKVSTPEDTKGKGMITEYKRPQFAPSDTYPENQGEPLYYCHILQITANTDADPPSSPERGLLKHINLNSNNRSKPKKRPDSELDYEAKRQRLIKRTSLTDKMKESIVSGGELMSPFGASRSGGDSTRTTMIADARIEKAQEGPKSVGKPVIVENRPRRAH